MNMQYPTIGTSHLILGDCLVILLQKLRTSWITTEVALGGSTMVQLYRVVELINPSRIVDVIIQTGTNNVPRSADLEEGQWEAMLVCLFTAVW